MSRASLVLLLIFATASAGAADDLDVSQLKQDVRTLQREVQSQTQQIEELRAQLPRPVPGAAVTRAPVARVMAVSGQWLDAAKWSQVQAGMSELAVISLLGAPTSMRGAEGERVLLYAMEIGTSGFLSGSVTLRDRLVVKIDKPVLK